MRTGNRRIGILTALGVAVAAAPALAVQPDEILKDTTLEARARSISAGLRCLVCQNQSIDDSDAPLARDLRLLVRERLVAGDSDDAVRSFLVQRYGDFVLLKPPFNAETLVLWLTPLLALGFAGWAARSIFRKSPAMVAAERKLTAEEEAALAKILASDRAGADKPA